ncbi:hypothetical protein BGW39_011703 [Mortierella sp. 14UC]|nr:hypothetical protein BGW39_011703 [Mortierella sp. 14UC]
MLALSVALNPGPPPQSADAVTTTGAVPTINLQLSNSTPASIPQDIFPKNITPATLSTPLPTPRARIEETTQLVYCCSLLSMTQPLSPISDTGELQDFPLNEAQQQWVDLIDPMEQHHLRWLVEKVVRAFVEDEFKGSAAVIEVVLLAPILHHEMYRSLLCCFIAQFEQSKLLDVIVLQGLVQLIEYASVGYLVDDDLVRIATVLFKELSMTHNDASDHVFLLVLALGRVLDAMVAGKVKHLNRDRDHQPMLQLLDGLKGNDNAYLKYQAAYAHQALQYVPDNETPLQILWRHSKMAAASAPAVSSILKLDPSDLLQGLKSIQEIGASIAEVVKAGVEGYQPLRESAGTATRAAEGTLNYMKKHPWYFALQGTALFIRGGRLSDFKQVVIQAPCRNNVNFQWGICRQLGEIAADSLWDEGIRQQAVDFLGELFRNTTVWKQHADVKRWVITMLVQVSTMEDSSATVHARNLLKDLRTDSVIEFPGTYPLRSRLPLPTSFPLLSLAQEIPRVEYDLHRLKMQRIEEYKQAVYIAPLAKPNLQAPDVNLFPLIDKVEEFLAGEGHVMLILGDSGAGKSTFNNYLEYMLLQRYKPGGPIPLFINLPGLERPENELVEEQLRFYNFSEEKIRELKLHRQFLLICDGYDESQLLTNIYTTNAFNQYGQWNVKLLISCRTQYLGPDYSDRFAPKAIGQHYRTSNDVLFEAVIAPFSKSQIELYVEKYVPLEPRTWVKEDYMDKLTTIPNLMDLVKNPFLLTLALEALPMVVKGKADLTRLRITRVELYDIFVVHWLGVNKRRLQDLKLKEVKLEALGVLLDDGFERNGVLFQKELAAAIFQEQGGRPVVDYSQMRDRMSWKVRFFGLDPERSLLRESSLLSRAGNHYRFVHRSLLEYFFSCTIWDATRHADGFALQAFMDAAGNDISIVDHPLSHRTLVPEPSIIHFLVERVRLIHSFKQHLLALIELSKSDPQANQAAANAITILVRAGVRFNGSDLRGVRIAGADLSAGQFDSVQLQDSDLTAVTLTKAWIREANFIGARMEGIEFGELPYLQEDAEVLACAFSPDGSSFAAGLGSGKISIYNISTWTRISTFEGHTEGVKGLVYSPGGQQLLSGSIDKTVRIWDCKTGAAELIMEGHKKEVTAAVFSPSGKQVASASMDDSVILWDASTGAAVFVLADHSFGVTGVAYSADGNTIATCTYLGRVRTFDTNTGALSQMIKGNNYSSRCLAFSPDGQRIVMGGINNGMLQLRDAATLESMLIWKGHASTVTSVNFSPNGQMIISHSHDNLVKLWDSHTGSLISVFAGHAYSVTAAIFSPDNSRVAMGNRDQTIRLWELKSIGSALDAESSFGPRTNVAYSPDGRSLVSVIRRALVQQYDSDTGERGAVCHHGDCQAQSIVFSPTGLQVAFGGSKGDVRLWNIHTGAIELIIRSGTDWINDLAYSQTGDMLVVGSTDSTVQLWDATSGMPGRILSFNGVQVSSVAFSPNGRDVLAGFVSGEIHVWDGVSGESKKVMSSDIVGGCLLMYLPGTSRLISCHDPSYIDLEVRLWNEEGKDFRVILERDQKIRMRQIAFSSCGQWVATSHSATIDLWKKVSSESLLQDWKHVFVVEGCFNVVVRIAWRPDSLEFATASGDGSTRVWRVVEESGRASVQLVWGSGEAALVASGAVLNGTVGLSTSNRRLLEQRGSLSESSLRDVV